MCLCLQFVVGAMRGSPLTAWCRLLLVLALTAFLIMSGAPAHALTTPVDPGDVFVVEEVVPPGHILYFGFQLHPDYLLTVSAKDRDTGILLQWWGDEESGVMEIQASDARQVYQFVFDNSNSVLTYKNVNFDVHVMPDPEFNLNKDDLDPIEAKIRALTTKMHKMKGLQQTLRYQRKDHRATVEDANARVLLWSVLQIVGFIVACTGQMLLLKQFLEQKRTV